MWAAFEKQCASTISTCIDVFGVYTSSTTCGDCPTCSCFYNETSTYYTGQWSSNNETYTCYECVCLPDNEYSCVQVATDLVEFNCPPKECITTVNGPEYCHGADDGEYCGVSVGYDVTNITGLPTFSTTKGCFPSWFCQGIPLDSIGCYFTDTSYTVYQYVNCFGQSELVSHEISPYGWYECCNSTNNCNANFTITSDEETRECTEVAYLETYYETLYQCAYSEAALTVNESIWAKILYCHASPLNLYGVDSCDYLEVYGTYTLGCFCQAYSTVYTSSSATGNIQNGVASEITYIIADLDNIDTSYKCGFSWSCDLTTGEAKVFMIEYYVTFNLTFNNYKVIDTADLLENLIAYVAGVTQLSSLDLSVVGYQKTIVSASSNTADINVEMKATFGTREAAETFSYQLMSSYFNFGTTATLDTSSVSRPETEDVAVSQSYHLHYSWIVYIFITVITFLYF